MHHVTRCAMEAWRASGRRSLARLDNLVRFYVEADGLGDELLPELQTEARGATRSWEIVPD